MLIYETKIFCPKPLLRPDISGKGLKEWSVDVFYDKMNIPTYPNGLHIPGIYPDFYREAWGGIINKPYGLHIPAIYPDFYRESLSLPVPIFHRETRYGRLGAVFRINNAKNRSTEYVLQC